ncbi:MAG: hypothetical protein ACI3YT_04350 [Prevotella sp.]
MRETFTQKRKSLLVMISMLLLAVIGGKAYAEVAGNAEAGETSVSITPAEGEVTSLKDFVVTFNGYEAADWSYSKLVQITDEEGNTYTLKNGENVSDAALSCSLDEAITAPGKYTLTIPKGAVKFNNVNENTNQEALVFEFVIKTKVTAVSSVNMVLGETSTDLLAGQNIEKLIGDADIVVKVDNSESIGVMTWEVNEVDGETVKSRSTEQPNVDGTFTFWNPIDIELILGKQYEIVFTGWESAEAKNYGEPNFTQSVIVNGGSKAYEYSPVTLVEPAELLYNQSEANFSLESAEDNTISFTFSDVVTIAEAFAVEGMGATSACSVEMSEDGKTANITIPSYIMNNYHNFVVSILAKDANGLVVKGNNGEKDGSYISVYVDAKFNLPEVTMVDPAPDATVEKISTIKFGYADGINASWNGSKITILDKARNVVATSTDITQVIPEEEQDNWDYIAKEVIVSFDNEITANGVYTVVVPEGIFNLDFVAQGFLLKSNREAIFNITVDNGDNPMPSINVSIDPVPGEVASLKDFDLIFNDATEAAWGDGFPTLTYPDGTVVKIKNQSLGAALNELLLSLDDEITAPGEYILTLPAASVNLDGTPTSQDYSFVYTIAEADNEKYTVTPEVGNVTSLKTIDVIFDSHSEISFGSGNPSLTDAAGNSYTVNEDLDWDVWNMAKFIIAEEITAEGTYTLTLPAGHINYEDSSNVNDIKFTWTIGNATAISNIFAAEGNVEIYNANGQLVKSGDASAIKSLAPNKMYIINGKKVIIK